MTKSNLGDCFLLYDQGHQILWQSGLFHGHFSLSGFADFRRARRDTGGRSQWD